MDIFGALRRMVTLPKAHNSLSDILGADAAHAITQTVHDLLAGAVTSALTSALTAGETEVGKLGGVLTSVVTGTLKDVSPALGTSINAAIEKAIHGEETLLLGSVPGVASNIVNAVGKVLKIAQ